LRQVAEGRLGREETKRNVDKPNIGRRERIERWIRYERTIEIARILMEIGQGFDRTSKHELAMAQSYNRLLTIVKRCTGLSLQGHLDLSVIGGARRS
jgi:hypothetical protein